MVGGGIKRKTLNPGFVLLRTHQQGVPVILRKLMIPDGFHLMSPSFTVSDVTTEVSGPRLTCRTKMCFQVGDRGSNPSGNISSLKITGTLC
ncbi:unnamed protein product [Schistosoma margrebowiei]|uniref:Uncharacterized protein n=1 Tax=Schistosoma margrebowiei TaxID=48269 RepID=A0A183M019_9TREM|nr:unnamed protein product [Schistosoma margrebowiei]